MQKNNLKITILGSGTSHGVPVIGCNCNVCTSVYKKDKRLRSSILIEKNDKKIVIDTGPDFRTQMLREKIKNINAIIYTHEHKDHIAGLDDIRAFNFNNKNKEIPLYCDIRVKKAIERDYYYAFIKNKFLGVPLIKTIKIDNNPFSIDNIDFQPILAKHYVLPVFGYKIDNFAYLTDVKTISEKEKNKLKNLDVLVLGVIRWEEHISHLNVKEALELIEEISPKKTFFTHISHFMGKHNEVNKKLPNNIKLAFDGQKIIC